MCWSSAELAMWLADPRLRPPCPSTNAGFGPTAGAAICRHPQVDKLAFTVSCNSSRACGVWEGSQAAFPWRPCLPPPPPLLPPRYPPLLPATTLLSHPHYLAAVSSPAPSSAVTTPRAPRRWAAL